ncbi:hypothetical protein IKF33_00345 [Candidatus Saccharibacteria bacterium]|nr:hypothetical protein [Candidatus Saccharibacteria bacterium]
MSRKSIYDLLEEKEFNPSYEFARLRYRFDHDGSSFHGVLLDASTIYHHIGTRVFDRLPIKGTCINLDDLLHELGINLNKKNATLDDIFNLAEFILCAADADYDGLQSLYKPLLDNIDLILEKTSHKIINVGKGKIIVPKDAKVEQAASLVKSSSLSLEILKYNHRSNIGNIENKRVILASIGKNYEVALKKDKSQLSSDIRFLLNSLDIRHDNREGDDRLIKIVGDNLEQWYDNLYSLFVAYIIEDEKNGVLEQVKRLKEQLK